MELQVILLQNFKFMEIFWFIHHYITCFTPGLLDNLRKLDHPYMVRSVLRSLGDIHLRRAHSEASLPKMFKVILE